MWTRAMLKYNARMAFKKNYINAVAVSLIYMILANLFDPSSSRGNSASNVYNSGLPERIKYREFDNLIRYEVHQSQIWLIFFVKS